MATNTSRPNFTQPRIGDIVSCGNFELEVVGIINLPEPMYLVRSDAGEVFYLTFTYGFFGFEVSCLVEIHGINCVAGIASAESFKYDGDKFYRNAPAVNVNYTASGQTSLRSSGTMTIHRFAVRGAARRFSLFIIGRNSLYLYGAVYDLPDDLQLSRNGSPLALVEAI